MTPNTQISQLNVMDDDETKQLDDEEIKKCVTQVYTCRCYKTCRDSQLSLKSAILTKIIR